MPPLSWVEMHGAVTHMPLAFLLAAPAFDIGAILFRKPEWRMVSFWLLVGAVVMSIPSLATGWITGDDLKYTVTDQPPSVFTQHRLVAFIMAGLALVQLLWRIKLHDQLAGSMLRASIVLTMVIAGVAGYTGYLGGKMVFGEVEEIEENAPQILDPAAAPKTTAKPEVKVVVVDAADVALGKKLYVQHDCASCHRIAGKGGKQGPDLTHEGRRRPDIAWQIEHLKNPEKLVPDSAMPAYNDLPPAHLKALSTYMVTLN